MQTNDQMESNRSYGILYATARGNMIEKKIKQTK